MVRLLRWATFLLLVFVTVGAVISYPLLRDRLFTPSLAAPAEEILPEVAAATTQATRTSRATVAPVQAITATQPALIIEAPSPATPAEQTSTPVQPAADTPTPAAIATTSLLPVNTVAAAISPTTISTTTVLTMTQASTAQSSTPPAVSPQLGITQSPGITITTQLTLETASIEAATTAITASSTLTVIAIATPSATALVTSSIGIAIPVTPIPPTPTETPGAFPAIGEKGYEPQMAPPSLATTVSAATATMTPILVITSAITPSLVTPVVVMTVEVTPAISAAGITPVVAISVELTPPPDTPTPLPQGPTARADSPLYSGPDFTFPVVGQAAAGEQLTIVGLYTEGTWYLLVNGLWINGAVVDNVPFALPLVFPTITPVPTNTPTVTTTPQPTATLVGSATPSPTPTSLDQAVCDCSGDNLDCLGNIFASRADAQQCFEYCFRQTGRDVHNLDPNLNGVACENLP